MKRILLLLFLVSSFCCGASAQNFYAKGDVSLGVGLSLLSDMDKNTGFEVNLSGSYHFSEQWEAGLALGYMRREKEFFTGTGLNDLRNGEAGFTLAPFVTYHWRIAAGFYFDLRGALACVFSSYNQQQMWQLGVTESIRETSFKAMVSPGLTYVINRHLQLEMRLGGLSWSIANKRAGSEVYSPQKTQSVALEWNSGINFGVGFRF